MFWPKFDAQFFSIKNIFGNDMTNLNTLMLIHTLIFVCGKWCFIWYYNAQCTCHTEEYWYIMRANKLMQFMCHAEIAFDLKASTIERMNNFQVTTASIHGMHTNTSGSNRKWWNHIYRRLKDVCIFVQMQKRSYPKWIYRTNTHTNALLLVVILNLSVAFQWQDYFH